MNKDLDDRLIPNGEYRDAQNISVGKSEADDIGSLETVLGNAIKTPTITPVLPKNIKIIGYLVDEYTSKMYIFATNYTDSNPNDQPAYPTSNTDRCIIYSWVPGSATATVIADGLFLNFSTTNPIQASLIENLLFFTDNRNQPRKVNVNNSGSYYQDETQISVAKYNPYLPVSLFKKTQGTVLNQAVTTTTFYVLRNTAIKKGMSVMSISSTGTEKVTPSDYVTVQNVIDANLGVLMTVVVLSKPITPPATGDIFTFLSSTMSNKAETPNWPGDPDYLEDRFVRFSYRYRFDDGEYSIMAPFSQVAYIPKQKGYFKNGDEDSAFRSTIVEWMENEINNIELLLTLPCNGTDISTNFKIKSLDILFKESDALAVKVLETISLSDLQSKSVDNIYTYDYQSRKPYKTLPQEQTTRVYDKVPVRAFSQETAGNRIIYGNFKDIHTAPSNIEYDVKVIDKGSKFSTSWIEYPNHTLKQNRNYQVGFILADKYGRQSSVILSPVTAEVAQDYLGSTLYLPYNTSANQGTIKNWFGKTLQLSVTDTISSGFNGYPDFTTGTSTQSGEPGLYAVPTNVSGFAVKQTPEATITNTDYTFTLDSTTYPSNVAVPAVDDYLRGEYIDFVKVTNVSGGPAYTITTDGRVNSSYLNDTLIGPTADKKFAYKINPIGWYSYKVVVKQTEQEYYNVYLPGILNGYPSISGATSSTPIPFPQNEENKTANIVLINDNINKVPRDLQEVGPDQKQFRSSVQLYGRVTNNIVGTSANAAKNNSQFYPANLTDTAISIATTEDSNMKFDNLGPQGQENLYQIDTKPLIARLSTTLTIGVETDSANTHLNMQPFLAIYETEPVESLLDIFWETGTVGLIADLNADVLTGYDGPVGFTAQNFELLESDAPGHPITDYFYPVSNEGTAFDSAYPTSCITFAVSSPLGDQTGKFYIQQDSDPTSTTYKAYRILTSQASLTPGTPNVTPSNQYFIYNENSITNDVFTFSITIKVDSTSLLAPNEQQTIQFQGSLTNIVPSFTQSPLPTINVTVDQTGDVNNGMTAYGQNTTAVNGTNSGNTGNTTSELKWSIVSGNPTGVNGQPSFDIVQSGTNGGNITQVANNTPSGQHTLVLKIEDCNGVSNVGGLNSNSNQIIIVGPQPANAGIESNCITGPINTNLPGMPIENALITKRQATGPITGVWYLSDNTLTASDFFNGSNAIVVPSTAQTGDASQTNTLFKIGSALTQGTMSLSMNASFTWSTSGPAGLDADVTWRVWHRTNSSSSWAAIADINNFTIDNSNTGTPSSGAIKVDLTTSATGQFGVFYDQRVLAYNQPGEYAIAAFNARSVTAPTQAETMACWVNSNDLYYSTCVIENGSNVTGGTAQSYKYSLDLTGSNSYYCPNAIAGSSYAYSHVPYGQYVTQFYTSSALSTVYSFADAGGGVSNYKGFITTAGSSPYNNGGTTKYKFSTRFNVSDAKVYVPNPWTSCYVQACSSVNGCSPNIYLYPFSP
jgi:hypothetical protein